MIDFKQKHEQIKGFWLLRNNFDKSVYKKTNENKQWIEIILYLYNNV